MKKQYRNLRSGKHMNRMCERTTRFSMSRKCDRRVVPVLVAFSCGLVIGMFALDIVGLLVEIGRTVPEKILDSLTAVAVSFVLRQLRRVFGIEGTTTVPRNH